MEKTRLERFNNSINTMEIGLDECLPDIPAHLVDATEILNESYYEDHISKRDYLSGKRRIDNITSEFFKHCLCKNLAKK